MLRKKNQSFYISFMEGIARRRSFTPNLVLTSWIHDFGFQQEVLVLSEWGNRKKFTYSRLQLDRTVLEHTRGSPHELQE